MKTDNPVDIVICAGALIDPFNKVNGRYDIYVSGGKVVGIREQKGKAGLIKGFELIDASGLLVVPGFVDIHTHLREPGYEYKETIASGSRAAVAGGFSTIACMANTNPTNDNGAVTKFILERAKEANYANVFPIGAATVRLAGESLSNMGELKREGCIGVSDDGKPIKKAFIMRKVMEYASMLDLPVISHPEDTDSFDAGCINEGAVSTRLGLKGIPSIAEELMVARDIHIAEYTGTYVHIAHISTEGSVGLIRDAKARGVRITAEVTPHHLLLVDDDIGDYDTNRKMNPPLRSQNDVDALVSGLADGTIDCIATDHAPHSSIEKDTEFDKAANGVVGLETAFSVLLRLLESGRIGLPALIEKMTSAPSRILGLGKGVLNIGADADIALIDMEKEWVVDPGAFFSLGRNTPFSGWDLKGRVVKTIVGGRVVYDEQ